jgi:hypothetical protein
VVGTVNGEAEAAGRILQIDAKEYAMGPGNGLDRQFPIGFSMPHIG